MMSEIIVGIDFSNSSYSALRLAVDIANRTHANIMMVWVEVVGYDQDEIKDRFDNLIKEHSPSLKGKKIAYTIVSGKVSHALNAIAKERNADLLVIGAHGNSGFDETFAGANAYKTVSNSSIPTLTIRENFNFDKPLQKIILPIDSTRDTRQKVPWTIEFAKMFSDTTICLLGLMSYKSKTMREIVKGYVCSVETLLEEKNLPFTTEYKESENSTLTTIEYAKEINADLIVIMTEQERTFTNMLFLGPFAQQMINLSAFPILTVPPQEIYNVGR
jgi:nucleotide-binding universal stress UspA family protein